MFLIRVNKDTRVGEVELPKGLELLAEGPKAIAGDRRGKWWFVPFGNGGFTIHEHEATKVRPSGLSFKDALVENTSLFKFTKKRKLNAALAAHNEAIKQIMQAATPSKVQQRRAT